MKCHPGIPRVVARAPTYGPVRYWWSRCIFPSVLFASLIQLSLFAQILFTLAVSQSASLQPYRTFLLISLFESGFERWMNMYEWWWFYMEEQIEKSIRSRRVPTVNNNSGWLTVPSEWWATPFDSVWIFIFHNSSRFLKCELWFEGTTIDFWSTGGSNVY